MRRSILLSLAAVTAVVGLVIAGAGQAAPAVRTLNGKVGPGFTISLKKGGKRVTSLKAGKVKIVVNDLAGIHNFHLTGPGVNKMTSISGTGRVTWTLRLRKGTYRFVCDPHASTMKGSFTVT
jgi:plastocyanin